MSKDMTFGIKNKTINRYLKELREHPQLSPEEVEQLPYLVKTDSQARIRMIEGNYRLPLKHVIYLVKRHSIADTDTIMELIQAGNMALIRAVDNFDASRGFKFSTYADFWIRYLTGEVVKKIYEANNFSDIFAVETLCVEGKNTFPDSMYSDTDSSAEADSWMQNRALYRLLIRLTPMQSKILRINRIFELSKKQRELECRMKNKDIPEAVEKIIAKVRQFVDFDNSECYSV